MTSIAAVKAAIPRRYRQAGRLAFLRLAAVANAGLGVECPCCARHFRKFARFYGLNDQCPGCGSLMRHRAILLYLRDVKAVGSSSRSILHVAPEPALGRWLSSIESAEYVSVDLDSPLADVHADITQLPFAADSFDLIVCAHVLEHVQEDRRAIGELFRVLRPSGTAIVQVPIHPVAATVEDVSVSAPGERQRVFGQWDHVRICGPEYGNRLEAAGFEVELVDYVERLDPETRRVFGLRPGEPFHVSTKTG
ncbi:MAG: methyltransferase domain-containing protein [Actinomycetota bacterium]